MLAAGITCAVIVNPGDQLQRYAESISSSKSSIWACALNEVLGTLDQFLRMSSPIAAVWFGTVDAIISSRVGAYFHADCAREAEGLRLQRLGPIS